MKTEEVKAIATAIATANGHPDADAFGEAVSLLYVPPGKEKPADPVEDKGDKS